MKKYKDKPPNKVVATLTPGNDRTHMTKDSRSPMPQKLLLFLGAIITIASFPSALERIFSYLYEFGGLVEKLINWLLF